MSRFCFQRCALPLHELLAVEYISPPPLPGASGSPVPCRPAGGLALGAPPPPVRRPSQVLPLPPPPRDKPMSPSGSAQKLTELEEGAGLACFGPHVELHIPWL